ncbi:MAG: hypothetical protein S0880_09105 [Actinomycetota bacterium]|nr:hypothetical protein [Actinomycetota bacterium]
MTYDPKRSRPRPGPSPDGAAPVDAILGGADDTDDDAAPRTVEAPAVTPPPVKLPSDAPVAEVPPGWFDEHRNEAIAAAVVAALVLVLVLRMRRSDEG